MKRNIGMDWLVSIGVGLLVFAVAFPIAAWAQGKPADNMQIMRDKIKADKKLVVASNMDLTESEAKGFWPVFDEYQKDLVALNERTAKMIKSYADAYNSKSMTDEGAKKLTEEFIAIEKAEVAMKESYVPKLSKVLPAKKVARYLQIENKIRALVKFDLAGQIPLVP